MYKNTKKSTKTYEMKPPPTGGFFVCALVSVYGMCGGKNGQNCGASEFIKNLVNICFSFY